MRDRSIGVFDSGVGGLGVAAAIRHELPDADLVYVADHERAPYGPLTPDEVRARCGVIVDWFEDRDCPLVTVACNTASAAALHHLRQGHPDTVFVGMEPAVKPAAESTISGRVGVVATEATFQGELFGAVVDRFAAGVEVVTAACPEWVRLVESGITTGPEAEAAVDDCLGGMLGAGVDVIVLACTHFPALGAAISAVAGPHVRLIDPAPAVARQTASMAARLRVDRGGATTTLLSTADPRRLAAAAGRSGFRSEAALLRLS